MSKKYAFVISGSIEAGDTSDAAIGLTNLTAPMRCVHGASIHSVTIVPLSETKPKQQESALMRILARMTGAA